MSGCCDDGNQIPGPRGEDGLSAYEVWLANGNTGTVNDYLASLQGPPGNIGPIGNDGAKGDKGDKGDPGDPGVAGDPGASYLTGVGNPSNSLGNDGDTYSNNSNGEIWQKASGVWTFTGFTLKGATGSVGSQGADGFSYYTGTGIPSPSLGNDGDSYSDNTTGDIYQKVAGVWNPTGDSLLGPTGASGDDGLGYDDTTSTTSTDILDTGATTETMTWTTGKAFIAGSRVRIADSSNPSANYFEGVVNTYDVVTGNAIVESVNVKVGTGTLASWNISIAGEQGGAASTPAWSAVLGAGATSGLNDPIIDAGQKLGINGGTTNAVEYNTFVSNVPQLKGANGSAITDGANTSVEVDNTNATVTTPVTGALILPSSNNPTADVSSPVDGMIKYRTQVSSEGVECYVNGAWVSLSSGSIIHNDFTQTGKRAQDLNGQSQEWNNGRFVLTDNNIEWNLIGLGNTGTSIDVDLHTGNMFAMTATDNFTLTFSNEVCTHFKIICTQDVTGSRTLTGGAEVVWPNGTPQSLTSGAGGAIDIIDGWSDGTNVYLKIDNNWS